MGGVSVGIRGFLTSIQGPFSYVTNGLDARRIIATSSGRAVASAFMGEGQGGAFV
jgi:hypothetical protein